MLGEVPSGWRAVRVGDLGGTYNGLSGKSKEDFGSGSPFVTYRQVFSGRPIDLSGCERVQIGPTENQSSVRKGDVLFTTSSETVEEVAFSTVVHADIPGLYLNSFCFGFRPHDGASLDAHFAQYFFRGPDFRTAAIRLGQGSTRYNISKTKLMEVPLRLPPLPEQKKIAAILSSVDEAIQATQAVIDQTRRVKEGLLQDLLTRGIGHTRFKQTEIGEIPEGWKFATVGELIEAEGGEIKTGPFGTMLSAHEYTAEGVPLVAVKEIRQGYIHIHTDTPRVPDQVQARLAQYLLRKGDIVFARKGGVDRCAVVETTHDMMLGSDAIRLRIPASIYPEFVGYYLQSSRHMRWMLQEASGSTMAGINQKVISRIPLCIPPFDEQLQMVGKLRDVDTALTAGRSSLRVATATKSGLLTDLLTGKVRVTP